MVPTLMLKTTLLTLFLFTIEIRGRFSYKLYYCHVVSNRKQNGIRCYCSQNNTCLQILLLALLFFFLIFIIKNTNVKIFYIYHK